MGRSGSGRGHIGGHKFGGWRDARNISGLGNRTVKKDDTILLVALVAALLLLKQPNKPKQMDKGSPFPVIDWLRDL